MNNLSLSEFIGLPDVKAKLKQEFVKPQFSEDEPLLAPVITTNPQMIGTAFDYLLRFYANCLNPNALPHQWVAENSLEILGKIKNDDTVMIDSKYRLCKARSIDQMPASYIGECKELKNKAYTEAKKTLRKRKKTLAFT